MILLWRIIAVLSLAEFFHKKKVIKNGVSVCLYIFFGNSLIHTFSSIASVQYIIHIISLFTLSFSISAGFSWIPLISADTSAIASTISG